MSGKTPEDGNFKLQSAMEYLMTYGWAILIIAVVIGALYQLGVFGTLTQGQTSSPGSCEVYRPQGPGTNFGVSLEGQCNNLRPQSVAQLNGLSYITMPQFSSYNFANNQVPFTITAWASPVVSVSNVGDLVANGGSCAIPGYRFQYNHGSVIALALQSSGSVGDAGSVSASNGLGNSKWVFLAATDTGSVLQMYINGALVTTGSAMNGNSILSTKSFLAIGWECSTEEYNGMVSNVQIYNSSLSPSEIQALYLEGIGGVPVKPQNLVGWWPLNGNANDYSGNNNNGQSVNGVTYTSFWTSTYTAP